ncbi:MAG: ATP-binding cassette domain-containing protein, partial [Deltaproteobacteria bacterium]|nr:ATP-binding cassette domain-containing protein [Deltaproteobacteria bacterium]
MHQLKIQKVSKSFKDRKVVDDVSFDVHSGQIIGLLGPNGAGKTT